MSHIDIPIISRHSGVRPCTTAEKFDRDMLEERLLQVDGGAGLAGLRMTTGRGLYSPTSQLNLSRFGQ